MSKTFVLTFFIIAGVVLGSLLVKKSDTPSQTLPSLSPSPTAVTSYRGELSGESVCLPHTDQSGPQTLECAFGLKTENGEYYALDLSLLSQEQPMFQTGKKFTAHGLITPVEMLSSNHWQKYSIKGIFSVTDSVKIEK